MTDLELLNRIMADMRLQLAADNSAAPSPGNPDITDPAIRFFAEQLQPRPAAGTSDPAGSLPPIDV